MNAAQVRSKARKAAQRRAEQIEQDEIEGGEINLVPYLDIVTNLLLFALVSVAASFVVGEINTSLPNIKRPPPTNTDAPNPDKPPNEQRLHLVVSVTPADMKVWSLSGLEGTSEEPRARIPVLSTEPVLTYDYGRLNDTLYEIADGRWRGKPRALQTYEVILQVAPEISYATVIKIMDHMRQRIPADADPTKPLEPAALPAFTPADGDKPAVIDEAYDPDKHWLFPDIMFAIK